MERHRPWRRNGSLTLLILLVSGSMVQDVTSQLTSQANLDFMADGLKITYDVITNVQEFVRYDAEIILENKALGVSLQYEDWQIRFNNIFLIEPDLLGTRANSSAVLPGQGIKVTRVEGNLFYLEPTPDFITLPPGGKRKIKFKVAFWSVGQTDVMPNWYLVKSGLQPKVIASTSGESLSFVSPKTTPAQWKRYNFDYYNPYTVEDRYERYSIPDQSYSSETRLIPKPLNLTLDPKGARVNFNSGTWTISSASEVTAEATYLATELGKRGLQVQISTTNSTGQRVIRLQLGTVLVENPSPEAYSITVDAVSQTVTITGRQPSGVFYGAISLLSLLSTNSTLPKCSIVDSPRFPYRGIMLDIARNFHTKDEIIKIIQLMSHYKLNRLHLHLSDDEGWRIQIPQLPELTDLGSKRCHDDTETKCLLPQLGSGPDSSTTFGSGFLTSAQYSDILQAANKHHVIVIPEIDMPGHARAAIKAMELRMKKLRPQGRADVADNTMLTEEGDPSEYSSPQMFSDNAINPCLDSTYNFVEIIIEAIKSMHAQAGHPLVSFHMGGDEVGKGAWVNSTTCANLSAQGVLPDNSPKEYFFQKVAMLAKKHNVALGVWEDGVMDTGNSPYTLSPDMPEIQGYAWDDVWDFGTLPRTYRMANRGYKVVMAHATHLYFDHPYEPDPEERGYYWATRFVDTKKTFSYSAENFYSNIDTKRSGEKITSDELCGKEGNDCPSLTHPENILGLEAPVFGETVRDVGQLQDRLFPRLLALAERAWHKAEWESLPKGPQRDSLLSQDWGSFVQAVGYREMGYLDSQNVHYRIPPPGAKVENQFLIGTSLYPGLRTEYSLDGGRVWSDLKHPVHLNNFPYRVWLRTGTQDGRRYSRTVILHGAPQLPVSNQPVIDYIAQNLTLQFTVVDNYVKYKDAYFEAKLSFTNKGNKTIQAGDWKIYFSSVRMPEDEFLFLGQDYIDHSLQMVISHVQGYQFAVGPTAKFAGLEPGATVDLIFKAQYWSIARSDHFPNWYVSSPGTVGKIIENTAAEDLSFVSDFNQTIQYKRTAYDQYNPWTTKMRYDRNLNLNVPPYKKLPIIPSVHFNEKRSDSFVDLTKTTISLLIASDTLRPVAEQFKAMLTQRLSNIDLAITTRSVDKNYIRFSIGDVSRETQSGEAYRISVDVDNNAVMVTGATPAGVFYGAVSLIHLALKSTPQGSIPHQEIVDWPRFEYRGMYLDIVRNFHPKSYVLKLLDAMAMYKLNMFHIHLSDDEGWRLEIPGIPDLTEVGGHRCHDLEEKSCIMSTLGSGPDKTGGFYTVDEYKEILRAAADRHITVIPEVESPGHAHAAIKAMEARRQRLLDLGDTVHADEYMLTQDHDLSRYLSVQYYDDNAINPCIESTYSFIKEIVHQLQEIHKDIQPLKVYHFGGDEVATGAWLNSTACRDLLRQGVNLKREFTRRVSLLTENITLAGWEDGMTDTANMPWNRSLLVNKDIIVHAWQNVWEWGGGARAHNLANEGYKVVLTPVTHFYLDMPQEPSPEERGFYWGTRYTDAYKAFSFLPDDWYKNIKITRFGEPITLNEVCKEDKSGCPPLTKPENVIGVQSCLWSETTRLTSQVDYMVFPRLLAIAERAWHKASWEGQDKETDQLQDWAWFASTLGQWDLALLDEMNITYRVPPPGARQLGDKVDTSVEFPGLQVQYTVVGSGMDWQAMDPKKTFSGNQMVQFRTVSPNGQRYSSVTSLRIGSTTVDNQGNTATSVTITTSLWLQVVLCVFMVVRLYVVM